VAAFCTIKTETSLAEDTISGMDYHTFAFVGGNDVLEIGGGHKVTMAI
jgi:hypothetical protein